jgi:hypothetical protein
MRFYTQQHQCYCGIDLHARSLYVCMVNTEGDVLVHRHLKAAPAAVLTAGAPSRDGLVVAVEWTLPLVLASGSLGSSGDSLRPGSCPRQEGHSRGPGQTRPDRFPKHCGLAARWDAPAGLCLSGPDACHP